jgi:BlaI family transcriptional regulator, penicillinase repressor
MLNRAGLSESERAVLKALWDHGPGTVREINELLEERGRQWAYTTAATLLQRLVTKGYVAGDSTVMPHIYRAVVTRQELLESRLRDAADELCDGRAAPLVLALVQGGRLSEEELARLRRLLDDAAEAASSAVPEKSRGATGSIKKKTDGRS